MSTKNSVMTSRPLMQELFASGLYKRNQGRLVRQITCLTIWVVVAVAAWRFHELYLMRWMGADNRALSYILATTLGGVGIWFGYRLVNWPKFADFLIAVEAEMTKVSWPTKTELIRSSMVVIFFIVALAAILFVFDLFWRTVFQFIGII